MENPDATSPKTSRWLRAIPLLLCVFAVVAAAAYCAAWYLQAQSARNIAMELINELNNGRVAVHYSALETEGFPFDVKVRLTQPKLSVHMPAPPPAPSADANAPAAPAADRVDEFTLAGGLTLSVNLASNRFSVQAEGPLMHTSFVNDTRSALVTRLQGPLTCALDLANDGNALSNLWNLRRLLQQNEASLAENFRLVECAAPGSAVGAEGSQAPMMSTGPFLLRLVNWPEAGGVRTLGLVIKVDNFEIAPSMNELLARYSGLFSGLSADTDLAAYGKQNVDIALALNGPADLHDYSADTPFSVTMARFNISNALYRTNSSLQLDNRVDGNRHSITFFLNSDSEFSKEYDAHVANYLHMMATRLQTMEDPHTAMAVQALNGLSPEQTMAAMEPVVPKLNEFGTIGVHVNANVEGDRELRNGAITVGTLEISSAPYAFSMQGTATLPQAAGQAPSNANFMLNCRNCPALVDDAAHYAERLQQLFATLNKDAPPERPFISPELAKGVQAFLSAVGEEKHDPATGAESLSFALMTDPAGRISLNGKTPAQVMDIYNASIAPYLPANADAAAGAPAAAGNDIPPGGMEPPKAAPPK